MKTLVKWGVGALVALLVVAAAGFAWAHVTANARNHMAVDAKGKDLPVPWPLTEQEIAAARAEHQRALAGDAPAEGEASDDAQAEGAAPESLGSLGDVDLTTLAMERAIARGKHIIHSRAGCVDCHKEDFGGGVIFDNGAMGRWVAPNITKGKGGVVADYTPADWDRILRHGVRKDGTAATMPAIDFAYLSDQEISDIIAYVSSVPSVDRENPPSTMGPIFKVLMATGGFPISAEIIDHEKPRPVTPPAAAVNVEYGKHLATVCVGCHGMQLSGGPIPGADPSWPPAANLTPHDSGLKGWSEGDFVKAMREGKRPDGSDINTVMPWKATANMTDLELKAIYTYLATLPPLAKGAR